MITELSAAFLAGLASFASPCVLPLIPGYLSYLTGSSMEELARGKGRHTVRTIVRAVLFVAGFSLVFILLGVTATAVGSFLKDHRILIARIGGAAIIVFGLHLIGVFKLRFLMMEKRYHGSVMKGSLGAVLLGMAFAFGWTPCVGPVLFTILFAAGAQETIGKGVALLAAYSAGLGLPFILAGAAFGFFLKLMERAGRYLRWVETASGVLLIVFGLLMVTGYLNRLFY